MGNVKKIKKYETIILSLLTEIKGNPNPQTDDNHIIMDTQNHHYQLLRVGWDVQNKYFFRVRIHFHITPEGKIKLLENRTEHEVADELIEKGVERNDIILGFLPTLGQQMSGYAVG